MPDWYNYDYGYTPYDSYAPVAHEQAEFRPSITPEQERAVKNDEVRRRGLVRIEALAYEAESRETAVAPSELLRLIKEINGGVE